MKRGKINLFIFYNIIRQIGKLNALVNYEEGILHPCEAARREANIINVIDVLRALLQVRVVRVRLLVELVVGQGIVLRRDVAVELAHVPSAAVLLAEPREVLGIQTDPQRVSVNICCAPLNRRVSQDV